MSGGWRRSRVRLSAARLGALIEGPGLDARAGASRACAGSCAVACGEMNYAPDWLWQIACDVLRLAREPAD